MWQQYGETIPDEGAVGGDIQAGRAPGKRFVNPEKPGAVFDVMAYPIFGDGTNAMAGPKDAVYVDVQYHYTVCRDVDSPGDTEEWSDVQYESSRVTPIRKFASVEDAEVFCDEVIKKYTPDRITWDGRSSLPGEVRP